MSPPADRTVVPTSDTHSGPTRTTNSRSPCHNLTRMSDGVQESAVTSIRSWVLTANVRPLVESLAALVDYAVDGWDWDAIEPGLSGTDADDPHGWYDYPLIGTTATLHLKLANDPGSLVTTVQVRHALDEVLTARIETTLSMLARYQVIA